MLDAFSRILGMPGEVVIVSTPKEEEYIESYVPDTHRMNSHPKYLFVRKAFMSTLQYMMESNEEEIKECCWVTFDFDKGTYEILETLEYGEDRAVYPLTGLYTDEELADFVFKVLEDLVNKGILRDV